MDYIWVYVLGGISAGALMVFLLTISKDITLTRRLKKHKKGLWLNVTVLLVTLTSLSLIIYLFLVLKEQLQLIG